MANPVIAQRAPIAVEVEAGKKYFWCSCGESSKQPFCDGSHVGTEFAPVEYEAADTTQVYFCCCKHSGAGVMCDGSHKNLPE